MRPEGALGHTKACPKPALKARRLWVAMDFDPFPPIVGTPPGWERRRVIVVRKGDWWTARVPSLPGCTAHGRTRQEALAKMQRQLYPWIKGIEGRGQAVPQDVDELDLAHVYPQPLSA